MKHSGPDLQPRLRVLDHLVLCTGDIPAAVRFYTNVLGMRGEQIGDPSGERRWILRFGQQMIELQPLPPAAPGAGQRARDRLHLCLLGEAGPRRWITHLAAHGVAIEDGPVQRIGAHGPIVALSVRDPDGHLIEIGTPLPGP